MNIKQQIEQEFKEKNSKFSDFFERMMYKDWDLTSFNNLTVEVVAQHGGEGEGESYYTVYSFDNGTEKVFVKFNGWYASYHGAEFTEWYFVEPKEKIITVYNKVK